MHIRINKDFKEYKDELARGFSMQEVISMVIALAVAIGAIYGIWRITGLKPDVCVYIAVPLVIPILAVGFYKYQGMSVFELIREMRYTHKTKILFFEAEENSEYHQNKFTITKQCVTRSKKARKRKNVKRRK